MVDEERGRVRRARRLLSHHSPIPRVLLLQQPPDGCLRAHRVRRIARRVTARVRTPRTLRRRRNPLIHAPLARVYTQTDTRSPLTTPGPSESLPCPANRICVRRACGCVSNHDSRSLSSRPEGASGRRGVGRGWRARRRVQWSTRANDDDGDDDDGDGDVRARARARDADGGRARAGADEKGDEGDDEVFHRAERWCRVVDDDGAGDAGEGVD